jgi:hypothetical protein
MYRSRARRASRAQCRDCAAWQPTRAGRARGSVPPAPPYERGPPIETRYVTLEHTKRLERIAEIVLPGSPIRAGRARGSVPLAPPDRR